LGGLFNNLNGTARSKIGALVLSDGSTAAWYPGAASPSVFNLSYSGSYIYISGPWNIGGVVKTTYVINTSGVVQALDPAVGGSAFNRCKIISDGLNGYHCESALFSVHGVLRIPTWFNAITGAAY
jgi:hypothetical protein